MAEQKTPDESPSSTTRPSKVSRDSIAAGLRAAYGPDPNTPRRTAHSVLATIEQMSGTMSKILLPDPPDERTPVVKTRSSELAEGPRQDGRYQVIGEIARGGVGVVMKGRDVDLGRDVAMKILLASHTSDPALIQRFVEEAQIGAQLQHPGIVPVYDLGMRHDQRPYFTMKLVKGQTLSAMLQTRSEFSEGRQKFIGIFEKVCQTMAYAHARSVIHRDLKPANIMVGAFGEVQIVDWGFAKVLGTGGVEDERRASKVHRSVVSIIETVRTGSVGSQSLAGSLMGTPCYMPPEQALGDVDSLDARSDVFALGAILCEILTGKPPYIAIDNREVLIAAAEGKVHPAYERLDNCGADETLIKLAKRCLAPTREVRPADAGGVANAIHEYLVSVEERVKHAEIRAVESKAKVKAAIARAEQERKSRRLTLALAASILVTVFVGGGAFLWMEQARATQAAETAHEVTTALEEAARLSTQAGTADAAAALPKWTAAVAAARRARAAIAAGEANEELTAQVEKSVAGYERREAKARKAVDQAEKNAVMLETLQNIRDGRGDDVTPASADRAYFEAFLNYGIDVDDLAPDKSAQAIVDSGIQPDLVAALDDWRWARSARPGYQKQNKRLLDVVVRADADEWLRELRYAINADDKITLRSLAETADAKKRSANALHLLAAALGYTNEDPQKAVALLRKARRYHPQDFWINFTLAYWLTRLDPPQMGEAIRFYTAALTIRPTSLGSLNNLAMAIMERGDAEEAIRHLERAIEINPKYARAHLNLGNAFRRMDRPDRAITEYGKALKLDPRSAVVHNNLGLALEEKEKFDLALDSYKKAFELDPNFAEAFHNMIEVLVRQGPGAVEKAIDLANKTVNQNTDAAWAYHSYGYALGMKGLTNRSLIDRAIEQLVRSVELDPTYGPAWNTLGAALWRAKRPEEAIEAYANACKYSPKSAVYRHDLGFQYTRQGNWEEAITHFNRATILDRKYANAWDDLGFAYVRVDKLPEAILAHKRALALQPDRLLFNTRLAAALIARGDTPQAAIALYRELKPTPPQAAQTAFYSALARAYSRKGDQDAAILIYRELIKINATDPMAHMSLGNFLYQKKDYTEALKCFDNARDLNPALINAHLSVANTYKQLKEYEKAKGAHEDALVAEEDGGTRSSNAMAMFLLSCPDKDIRDYSRAVILAKKAIRRAQRSWFLYNTLGIANYRAGNYKEAVEAFNTAMEEHVLSKGNAYTWICLSMAHWKLDKKDKARKRYAEADKWCKENRPNDFVKELKAEADAMIKE